MESKVATYTEPNVRLQLVRIVEGSLTNFEIRYNRRVISRLFSQEEALFARMYFCHLVGMICVERDTVSLSKITT